MSDKPIAVEVWRHYYRVTPDPTYATFDDAARAAVYACDANTAAFGTATNTKTGETRSRAEQLDQGRRLTEPEDEW